MTKGFLVVPKQRGTQFGPGRNPRYRVIYRMPMRPSTDAREDAFLQRHTFETANDDGLIDEPSAARELAANLGRFGREFEILYCELVGGGLAEPPAVMWRPLGYDVTPIGGDYLSHVGRFPSDERFDDLLNALNEDGLFDDCRTAIDFLGRYIALRQPEWDVPSAVFRIWLVEPEQGTP